MIEIYDIDGTLTLPDSEEPREDLIAYVKKGVADHGVKILIVTGRPVRRRAETEKWLEENGVPFDAIYLQDFSDESSPEVIEAFKAFKYSKLLEQYGDEIAFLVDDDADAREAAEGMGIHAMTPDQALAMDHDHRPSAPTRADAPAPPEDQISGSDENDPGSAQGKIGDIEISEETETALQNKADEHNAAMRERDRPEWTRVRVGALRSVYRRGAGAYSSSHRPGIGRAQWAMARVNAFLVLARTGSPENPKYVGDNDLLDPEHPKYSGEAKARAIDPDGYLPTAEMREEAERGLEWRREFGRGGTEVGVARARDISNGRRLPYDTVVRISSYLARHEVDKEAQGFSVGEDGYPSAGRIAWALWGGDPAKAWASRIINEAAADDAARNEGEDMGIQFRTATAELRAVDPEGFTFEGMAAIYDSPSADGTTPEVVKPGAFARSLAAAERGEWDIKAYADHNPERLLGTTKTGTLELTDTPEGLRARVKLNPNVSFHRDLAEIVRTMGKSLGLSFGFFSTNANRVNDEGVRELREVKLVEVSALTGLSPYYPSTISTVSVRSLASEAGLEIEPLRAAVNALLAGEVTEDQAKILADAIAAVIAEDESEAMEEVVPGEPEEEMTVIEEVPAEESAPRAVPRAIREKQIELARRALK